MKPPDATPSSIVARAALGALTEARRRRDALWTRSADDATGLLREQAVELAFSSIGRDQLLSAALTKAADDLEHDRPFRSDDVSALPRPSPSDEARTQIRRDVFGSGVVPTAAAGRVLEDLELRYRPDCRSAAELAARLREDATLHEAIWDDPRLPARPYSRLVMLFSVPKLLGRAEALLAPRPAQARGVIAPPPRPTSRPRWPWVMALRPAG